MIRRTAWRFFNQVSVWGGGTMGGGIALVAGRVAAVTVVEVNEERAMACEAAVKATAMRLARKESAKTGGSAEEIAAAATQNVRFTTDEVEAASSAELIIEAVVEDLSIKTDLWRRLDMHAPPECVFATNTSSLSVAAQAAATTRPSQVAGLHFFSPVPIMPLVELIEHDGTSPEVSAKLRAFAEKLGKTVVKAKDTRGFIVNRLLVPYLLESMRLVERGVASVPDVDKAMRLGANHPMGPFELADSIGLDVIYDINRSWHKAEPGNPLFEPVAMLGEKVNSGKLGRKSGEGFHVYKK